MSVPDTVKNTAQGLRFSFLWKNRKDKIKGNVVCQQLKNGGLNFVNFGIMVNNRKVIREKTVFFRNDGVIAVFFLIAIC